MFRLSPIDPHGDAFGCEKEPWLTSSPVFPVELEGEDINSLTNGKQCPSLGRKT